MKQMSEHHFLEMFEPRFSKLLRERLRTPGVEGIVLYENLNLYHPRFGQQKTVLIGSGLGCRLLSIKDADRLRDGEHEPIAWCLIEKKAQEAAE